MKSGTENPSWATSYNWANSKRLPSRREFFCNPEVRAPKISTSPANAYIYHTWAQMALQAWSRPSASHQALEPQEITLKWEWEMRHQASIFSLDFSAWICQAGNLTVPTDHFLMWSKESVNHYCFSRWHNPLWHIDTAIATWDAESIFCSKCFPISIIIFIPFVILSSRSNLYFWFHCIEPMVFAKDLWFPDDDLSPQFPAAMNRRFLLPFFSRWWWISCSRRSCDVVTLNINSLGMT